MHILCTLFFIETHYQFEITAKHIPGTLNTLWLLDPRMDWTLSHWTQQFNTFVSKAKPNQLGEHINQHLNKFANFCSLYSILTPFPVSESLLCYFSANVAYQKLFPQTKSTYQQLDTC